MPKRPSEPAVRYVVSRLNWRRTPAGFVRLPGEVRVASFDTIQEAEAERRRREADAREQVNPFACGPMLGDLTTLPEFALLDWMMDAGLTPPKPDSTGVRNWRGWWEAEQADWSDDARAKVWEALNCVRFFSITTEPTKATAFVVVRIMWEYNDNWMEPGQEGGEPVRAFRRREDAEAYRDLLDQQERERFPAEDSAVSQSRLLYEMDRWRDPFNPLRITDEDREYDLRPGRQAQFYEVTEVELASLAREDKCPQ